MFDRPEVELLLESLFLEPRPARLERLRRAAAGIDRGSRLPTLLETHGVLVLAERNLALAGAELPDPLGGVIARRSAELREDARRFRLTFERFSAAARGRGIELLLLKGASLARDVYADPAVRGMGDLDVLVAKEDVPRAMEAAAEAGLHPAPVSLPRWWYLRHHFHLKLRPGSAFLREIELHWALHPPSALLTPEPARPLERRSSLESGLFTLAPADRFLHLATHLIRHAYGVPGQPTRETLMDLFAGEPPVFQAKWILDLAAELERPAVESGLSAASLADTAGEWGAAPELAWVAALLADLDPGPEAAARLEELCARLPAPVGATGAVVSHGERPLPGLDFRRGALTGLIRWAFPPASYLSRRYPRRSAFAARALHALGVLGNLVDAVLLLPCALVGRALLAPQRRRALSRENEPERVLDLAVAWRSLSRD